MLAEFAGMGILNRYTKSSICLALHCWQSQLLRRHPLCRCKPCCFFQRQALPLAGALYQFVVAACQIVSIHICQRQVWMKPLEHTWQESGRNQKVFVYCGIGTTTVNGVKIDWGWMNSYYSVPSCKVRTCTIRANVFGGIVPYKETSLVLLV